MELKLLIVFIVFLLWTRHLTSAATPKICYVPMLCDGKPVWINLTKCSQEEIEVKFSNEITRLTGEVIYLQDQFAILEKARHDLKCTTQATVTAPSTSNHLEVLAKSKPAEQLMKCLVPAHCEDGQDYLEMHIWCQKKGTSSCMTMYSDKVQIIQEMSADVVFLHNRLARMQKTLHALQTAKQATVETPSTSNTELESQLKENFGCAPSETTAEMVTENSTPVQTTEVVPETTNVQTTTEAVPETTNFQTTSETDTIRSNITCEAKRFSISCAGGKTISIIHANYGREDEKTCPHDNILFTSCNVPDSTAKVGEECDKKRSCSFMVKNDFFGPDPCPHTYKYLNVSYSCTGP